MNPSDALAFAITAETRWRDLQLDGIDFLRFSPAAVAERHAAEGVLQSALMDLGAAILRFCRIPEQWECLQSALRGSAELAAEIPSEIGLGAPECDADTTFRPVAEVLALPLVDEPPAATEIPYAQLPPIVRSAPAALTTSLLQDLKREMTSGRNIEIPVLTATPKLEDAVPALRAALANFGEPLGRTATTGQLSTEAGRLLDIASQGTQVWATLPEGANFVLTAWITARCRHLQILGQRAGAPLVEAHVGTAIRRLSAHSKQSQPGFIYGLALHHEPQFGDWGTDAAHWRAQVQDFMAEATAQSSRLHNHDDAIRVLTEQTRSGVEPRVIADGLKALIKAGLSPTDKRLVNLARPYVDALDGSALASLRKAIREVIEAESEAEGIDADRKCVPADWPFLAETRGRIAVIVGGEPRKERADRLKMAFDFAAVEWVEGSTVRKVDGLRQRMQSGNVGLVIVLRAFNSHKVSDAIFDVKSPSCVVVLADGYGLTQVRLGLERFLARGE